MRNNNHQLQDQDQPILVSMDTHKNPNLIETTHNYHQHMNIHISKKIHQDELVAIKKPNSLSCSCSCCSPTPLPQDLNKPHDHQDNNNIHHVPINQAFTINNPNYHEVMQKPNSPLSSSRLAAGEEDTRTPPAEESGRDRLKRHRMEMAGRVWIPDIWGHEDLLKDWIDCTVFDSSLGNNNIMSARAALVQEGRRSTVVRIQNQC